MDFGQLVTAVATNGIGAACAAAVLWFAWHQETKTIPRMMETFADTIKNSNAHYDHRQDRLLETFSSSMHEERTMCQKHHEENRQGLEKLFVETKEQRHGLKNIANILNMRQVLEEERKRPGKQGEDER